MLFMGFCESRKSVTDDRACVSEASINGICPATDGLKASEKSWSCASHKATLQIRHFVHANFAMHLEKEEKEDSQKQL